MYAVPFLLDDFNLRNVACRDVFRLLDVKFWGDSLNDFRFAKMFCDVFSCHLCDGSRPAIVTGSRFGVGDSTGRAND